MNWMILSINQKGVWCECEHIFTKVFIEDKLQDIILLLEVDFVNVQEMKRFGM